jgi:hypothetical protein
MIRRLRGGSQAYMVQCEDEKFYVAKFAGNPQGNRTLINEWLGSHLIKALGVSTPDGCILSLPTALRRSHDAPSFSMGKKRVPVVTELHFGTACPVNPETTAIFDFLPDRLSPKVANLSDFATTWVIDRWLHKVDARQAVYVREKNMSPAGFRAFMIDHKMSFNGPHWELRDILACKADWNQRIYQRLDMPAECERALTQIECLMPECLTIALRVIPSSWFRPKDRERLDILIDELWGRRKKLCAIIPRHLELLATKTANLGTDGLV